VLFLKKIFLITCCIFIVYFSYKIVEISINKQTIAYSYGSRGDTVITIQTKLTNWGYYSGVVDGVYGYQTYMAIKYFQRTNGLYPDGVAGNQTLVALGISIPQNYNASAENPNKNLLGRIITGEARGEPYIGQVAIGGVVMNRTNDPRFPSTIPGVIYQAGAFTAVDDGQIDLPPDTSCLKAAGDALNGWDPSGGAIYYYNPATATNKWIWSRPVVKVIGHHVFCK
jgi:N-acetylmuramoyl-L-alanine amidase